MHPSIMPLWSTRLLRACGALTAVLFLSISPAAAQAVPARTLDIAGNAEVHAVPDAALVSTGAVTESETAAAALKANRCSRRSSGSIP